MAIKITEDMIDIWSILAHNIGSVDGVAGLMGNLYAESACRADNLQNSYAKRLGMTDAEYTKAVDDRKYTDFATDHAGYGLAQWTAKARKQNLYGFAACCGASIGDPIMQSVFMVLELQNYSIVNNILKNATSVYDAAYAVLRMYEKPANVTSEKASKRAQFGREIMMALEDVKTDGVETVPEYHVLRRGAKGDEVQHFQHQLMALGYRLPKYGADGKYGKETADAVRTFQSHCKLYADGIAGSVTQYCVAKCGMD